MDTRHKVLLLDDEPDLLDLYRQMLSQLPSQPEIHTAASGPRAMALLEAEPFRLLICDLKMPRMDGLQVLSIVRRKYPQLRTVVLTSLVDEQFRSRAYALGVDLFWNKPSSEKEIQMFLECIESLLGREAESGFRGVQSKSLMDIIQLECMSQSSSVLRITNGPLTGRIWIQDGEILDAETDDLQAEPAFQKLLSWRTGHFETLPAEPNRARTIQKSYNALLLESAQALDELAGGVTAEGIPQPQAASPLARLSQVEGVEFVLISKTGGGEEEARGLENPQRMAAWTQHRLEAFRSLGGATPGGLARTDRRPRPSAPCRPGQPGQHRFLRRLAPLPRARPSPRADEKTPRFMGFLNLFSKPAPTLLRLPSGSFTVDRNGEVITRTLPSSFPQDLVQALAAQVLSAFRDAAAVQLPLAELVIPLLQPQDQPPVSCAAALSCSWPPKPPPGRPISPNLTSYAQQEIGPAYRSVGELPRMLEAVQPLRQPGARQEIQP